MRIGIVIDEFDPARGGMEEWCRQFVAAVAGRGHEVHIIARRFGAAPLPARVVPHHVAAGNSRTGFAHTVESRLRELQLDVVHDMGAGWHCDIFQPHGGSHLAWVERRADMYPRWWRALKRPIDALLPRQRDFLRHCRRQFALAEQPGKTFVALAKTVADDFIRFHQVRPEQIEIIYNGVDCRRYAPENRLLHRDPIRQKLGIDGGTLLLLLATHNFRRKGLPELLKVASRLAASRRPVHVAVAGRGRLARWGRAAARLGLANRVTFLGAVSDMVPYYAAADAYVHPTYYDQCSLVILEAAACGLPIVTTRRHNGTAEMFREGDEILTVADPRDADALYDRVDALFDERLRTKLSAGAREAALRHPFERNVAEILRLYDGVAGRRLAA